MRDGSVASCRLTSDIPTLKINLDLSTTFDYLYLIPTDWKSTVYRILVLRGVNRRLATSSAVAVSWITSKKSTYLISAQQGISRQSRPFIIIRSYYGIRTDSYWSPNLEMAAGIRTAEIPGPTCSRRFSSLAAFWKHLCGFSHPIVSPLSVHSLHYRQFGSALCSGFSSASHL